MNKARLLLTAGVVAGIFAAGGGGDGRVGSGARMAIPGESHAAGGRQRLMITPGSVRSYADWSSAYARTTKAAATVTAIRDWIRIRVRRTQWNPAVGYVRVRNRPHPTSLREAAFSHKWEKDSRPKTAKELRLRRPSGKPPPIPRPAPCRA